MASPIIDGTNLEEVYTSRNIDILNEKINIRFLRASEAEFTVVYTVKTEEKGLQVPFIFDTYNERTYQKKNFKVSVDGMQLDINDLPDNYSDNEVIRWLDSIGVIAENIPDKSYFWRRFYYFEADFSEGVHSIEVIYTAIATKTTRNPVLHFSYRYNLAPARYWRSFGELVIEIDDSALSGQININLPAEAMVDSVPNKIWKFAGLPQDIIIIDFDPQLSTIGVYFNWLGTEGVSIILWGLLIIAHLFLLVRYRKKHINKRFSPYVIAGSIVVPIVCCFGFLLSCIIVDEAIGEYASRRHEYSFFIFFLYPVVMPFYLLVCWLLDRLLKKYYRKML